MPTLANGSGELSGTSMIRTPAPWSVCPSSAIRSGVAPRRIATRGRLLAVGSEGMGVLPDRQELAHQHESLARGGFAIEYLGAEPAHLDGHRIKTGQLWGANDTDNLVCAVEQQLCGAANVLA